MSAQPPLFKTFGFFSWLRSWKYRARVCLQTFVVYRSGAFVMTAADIAKERAAVERIAAFSTHLQVICWPCLEAFNERSQRGEDPDYSLAFGYVSIAKAIEGRLPICASCGRPKSLVGTSSAADDNEYKNFCQARLAEAREHINSSLAFLAARKIATLGRKPGSGS